MLATWATDFAGWINAIAAVGLLVVAVVGGVFAWILNHESRIAKLEGRADAGDIRQSDFADSTRQRINKLEGRRR